jgi:hypothetical protein
MIDFNLFIFSKSRPYRSTGFISVGLVLGSLLPSLAFPVSAMAQPATAVRVTQPPTLAVLRGGAPASLLLPANSFTPLQNEDLDHDSIHDGVEHRIAAAFKPHFIFDDGENALNPDEPLTLYQVHRDSLNQVRNVSPQSPQTLRLVYAYLFRRDGGYVYSTFCGDAHDGDNQTITLSLRVTWNTAAQAMQTTLESLSAGRYLWPTHAAEFFRLNSEEGGHVQLYLSAGKHHPFFSVFAQASSPYSRSRCADQANGRGQIRLAALQSQTRSSVRFHNVGELRAHPSPPFVDLLGEFGFPYESAWSTHPFCGGLSADHRCSGTGSMRSLWIP